VARDCKNPPKAWDTASSSGVAAAVSVAAPQDPTPAEAAGLSASKGSEPAGPGEDSVLNTSDGDDVDEDENCGSVGVGDDGCDDAGSDDDDGDGDGDGEGMETQASQSILSVGPTTSPGPSHVDSSVNRNVNESINNESLNTSSSENNVTNNISESITCSDKSSNKSLHKSKQSNVSGVKGISSKSKTIKKTKTKPGQLEHSQISEGGPKGTDDDSDLGGCLELGEIGSDWSDSLLEDGQRVNTPLLQTDSNKRKHASSEEDGVSDEVVEVLDEGIAPVVQAAAGSNTSAQPKKSKPAAPQGTPDGRAPAVHSSLPRTLPNVPGVRR